MNTRVEDIDRELPPIEASNVLATISKAEIDQQIATAHAFPRSIKQFRAEALSMVTLNERIAEECIYAIPRDGKTIEGPSARFAEIILSAWGNCRAGARTISDEGDFVTAQGAFHDLERNVNISYETRRRITNKAGKRYSPDMISVTANAACSIALRNAILKGIPKAFWTDMYEDARKVVMGDVKTIANRRADAIAHLQKFGITVEQICETLGVKGIEDIGQEQLVALRGIATAIKDGDTTPEQAFAQTLKVATPHVPAATKAAPVVHVDAGGKVTTVEGGTQDGEPMILAAQLKILRKMIEQSVAEFGLSELEVCKRMGVDKLESLTRNGYIAAVELLSTSNTGK